MKRRRNSARASLASLSAILLMLLLVSLCVGGCSSGGDSADTTTGANTDTTPNESLSHASSASTDEALTDAGTATEAATAPVPVTDIESAATTIADTAADTAAETDAESVPATEPELETIPATEAETETAVVTDSETEVETETETETEPIPEEMTMPPVETIAVITDGRTDYTILTGEGVMDVCAEDLSWLCGILDEKYGTCPIEATAATDHTIFMTIQGESMDWSVSIDSETESISLTGGSAAALKKAIQYFATQFCGGSDGDLNIPVSGSYTYTWATDQIDNSGLLSYMGRETATPSDEKGELMSPAWLDTAVMVEVRLDTFSLGGTFQTATRMIDFYATAGVNVIWLCPIYERGVGGNGYGNQGLHTVEPALTGTTDMAEGWAVVKEFVDYAHSKGIYILFDLVSWGTMKGSALTVEHPDWFSGEAWGNAAFNWNNEEFKEWFIAQAVYNIEYTGADGYRCDCEPFTAGYGVYTEIRRRLNEKGIYPLIMSEEGGERQNAFDCEQDGVLNYSVMTRGQLYQQYQCNFFVDGYLSIIKSVKKGTGLGSSALQSNRRKAGTYRYYTNCITNHDYQNRSVCGNRLKIGYAALYAPFIPIWYMGDEFSAGQRNAVLYDKPVDASEIETVPEKGLFFEDVKQMIAIRRTYSDIFEYFPLNHRDANLCEVTVDGFTDTKTPNYARYRDDRMVIIVANNDESQSGICRVEIPFEDGFACSYYNYRVTDLLTGRVVAVGRADTVDHFSAVVPYEYCGVFLVEGIDPIPAE